MIAAGREGSCRFGPNCLIVDFTIEEFPAQPTEFVCEFRDGSRFTFRFESQAVEGACSTSDAVGTIVVEIDGVRSATITR